MNNLIYFFLLATALKYSQPECIDEIKKLAKRDKCLSSRADLKRLYAKTETKEMFVTKIITSKCKGTEFACGLTRSWVSEVFVGLANQYLDSKNDQIEDGTAIGYNYLVGDELKSLFNTNKNSAYTIIYQVRMVGDEDHDWVIEQLPLNRGYRIYQSYHDAFSLNAWLSGSVNGLYNAVNGDIMLFNTVKAQASGLIQMLTNGKYNLSSNWQDSTEIPSFFKPFIQYIRDYNQTTAVNNFERAWMKYGRGLIIPTNIFDNYVNTLASMASYFKTNDNTATPFSESIWNDWIDLFGSPNPVHYPNLAHNALTQYITPGKTFRFEIKKIPLTVLPNCMFNAFYVN